MNLVSSDATTPPLIVDSMNCQFDVRPRIPKKRRIPTHTAKKTTIMSVKKAKPEYIYLTNWDGSISKTPTKFVVGTRLGELQQGYHRVMFTGPDIYGKRFFRSERHYFNFMKNRALGFKKAAAKR